MILYIDTTKNHTIEVAVKDKKLGKAVKKVYAPYKQAEKLLPLIDALFKKTKIKINQIKKVRVANKGGSFTALRIGVATANALGYALGVPVISNDQNKKFLAKRKKFNVIKPIYDKEPNIIIKPHNR